MREFHFRFPAMDLDAVLRAQGEKFTQFSILTENHNVN